MKIRLAVADPDPVFAAEIISEFELVSGIEVCWSQSTWDGVERLIESDQPHVVVFGPGWAKSRVISGFEKLRYTYSDLQAVLVTAEYSTDLRRQAADAGFVGVYGIPIDTSELLLCVRRVSANGGPTGKKRTKAKGRFITVFSTKGGVGKTVISTNLAVSLGKEAAAGAIIVDLDLQFGDVGVMLKLMPKHTLHDLVDLKSVDLGQLQSLLTGFNDRVKALVAPLQPELADLVTPDVIRPIFSWLRQAANYIIIDTPPCFNDNVLAVLDETDELYLVSTLDLPSLKNIKLCLQTLKLLDFDPEKMRLVLNRVDRNLGLTPADVEAVIKQDIAISIPNDPAVTMAVNKGVPVIEEAPRAPASKALIKLKDIITKDKEIKEKNKKVGQNVLA